MNGPGSGPSTVAVVTAAAALLTVAGCRSDPAFVEAAPGDPLPGLDEGRLERFAEGRRLFNRPFTPAEGLGPLLNQDRCSSCHDLPTSGGHGAEPVTRFSRFDAVQGCSALPELGGDLRQAAVTETARAGGLRPEEVPSQATHFSDVRPTALYGLGLVARIDEAEILARADPADGDGDGISGRPNRDLQGRLGRFGRKAQHASLRAFSAEALLLEMGVTSPSHPDEVTRNGEPIPGDLDPATDPESDAEFVALLVDYIDLLAPPARRQPDSPAERADVEEGERIFAFMGCDACHTPFYTLPRTADDGTPLGAPFAGARFRLYSDLLLHDLGPDLADHCTPGTTPAEWKTARLVGLGHRSEFLHNGRAQQIEGAIELHGGEAAASREVYRRLTPEARRQVLAFLRSL